LTSRSHELLVEPAERRTAIAGDVAGCVQAGAAIARMNVESNLRTLPDSDERSGMLRRMGVAR